LNEFPEQLSLLQKVLATKEKQYGPNHVELARTLHNLGLAYGNQGDHERKLEMLDRCLAIKQACYERNSMEHVPTLRSKAQAHLDLAGGAYNEQYRLYVECLQRAKVILEAQPQRGRTWQRSSALERALRAAETSGHRWVTWAPPPTAAPVRYPRSS